MVNQRIEYVPDIGSIRLFFLHAKLFAFVGVRWQVDLYANNTTGISVSVQASERFELTYRDFYICMPRNVMHGFIKMHTHTRARARAHTRSKENGVDMKSAIWRMTHKRTNQYYECGIPKTRTDI